MNNQVLIRNLSIWGAVFVVLAGPVVHFMYGWSGNNFIVGLLGPVNESPWEHMKLVFTPLIIFAFVDYYFLRSFSKNYCFALAKEVSFSIIFILAVFYIYTPIVGHSILAVDIGSFIVAVILAKLYGYMILSGKFKKWEFRGINAISVAWLVIVSAFFVYATINPPKVNLFLDENTSSYGIYNQQQ